jgi:streptogramin lyase
MAGFEFEARLRLGLREAAEREQRRGRLARFVAAGRSLLPGIGHSALPAAAVTATVAAAIAVATIFMMSETDQRPVAPPEVVAEFTVADSLGETVAAYGSVWMNDTSRADLVRVDPDSRRVTARLPVRGQVSMTSGAGSLWALQEGSFPGGYEFHGPLLRIDPGTGEVTARIPLRTPAGQPFAGDEVLAARDAVWVGGLHGALRIDPRTDRVTEAIALPGDYVSSDFALWRGGLWALTADGRLLRFDPSTGAKLSEVRLALPPATRGLQTAGDALITTVSGGLGGLARIDPYSGRVLWSRRLGQSLDTYRTEAGGLIWARSSGRVRDRLHALDPDTGRVLTSLELHDFSGAGIAAVDDELWLSTVGGGVVVLRR